MSRDPVRDEAERLVAAAIGSLSIAARGLGTGGRFGGPFATGSDECCVCPICRVIAAMREPDPTVAERLATGAGDLATAVAGVLRSFARGGPGQHRPEHDEPAWAPGTEPEDPWRAATAPPAPKPMAKKALRKAAPQASESAGSAPIKKAAKKAVKKAAPRKAPGRGDSG